MKILINDLLGLENFYSTIANQKLPIKASYKLTKIMELVTKETNFYREKLAEIIQTYSIKDDEGKPTLSNDGQQILIQPDKVDECNSKLKELNELEVEINVEQYKLNIDEIDSINCSAAEMSSLIPFLN